MTPPFHIGPHTRLDKRIPIKGPEALDLEVDVDDVDFHEAEAAAEKMVAILNEHWPEEPKPDTIFGYPVYLSADVGQEQILILGALKFTDKGKIEIDPDKFLQVVDAHRLKHP